MPASDKWKKDQLKAAAQKNSTKRVTLLMENIPEMSKKLLFFFCHSAVPGKCPTNSSLSHAPFSPVYVFQDLLLKLQNLAPVFCSPYYQVIIRISSPWDNAIKFGKGKKHKNTQVKLQKNSNRVNCGKEVKKCRKMHRQEVRIWNKCTCEGSKNQRFLWHMF